MTEIVVKTFIRKYTHARIGGFVKGGTERNMERKGHRSKGGGTLREKLTHVAGVKGQREKRIMTAKSAGKTPKQGAKIRVSATKQTKRK